MLENKRAETLRLLRESGKNVSGQELCEHFGISRTAVWKMMNQLKEDLFKKSPDIRLILWSHLNHLINYLVLRNYTTWISCSVD